MELNHGAVYISKYSHHNISKIVQRFQGNYNTFYIRKGHRSFISVRVYFIWWPIPVDALAKAWACSRSFTGTAGSNPAGGVRVCLL